MKQRPVSLVESLNSAPVSGVIRGQPVEVTGPIVLERPISVVGNDSYRTSIGGQGCPGIIILCADVEIENIFAADEQNYKDGTAILIREDVIPKVTFTNVTVKGKIRKMSEGMAIHINNLSPNYGGKFYMSLPMKNGHLLSKKRISWLQTSGSQPISESNDFIVEFEIKPNQQFRPGDYLVSELLLETDKAYKAFWVIAGIGDDSVRPVKNGETPYVLFRQNKIYFFDAIVIGSNTVTAEPGLEIKPKELLILKNLQGSLVCMDTWKTGSEKWLANKQIFHGNCAPLLLPSTASINSLKFAIGSEQTHLATLMSSQKIDFGLFKDGVKEFLLEIKSPLATKIKISKFASWFEFTESRPSDSSVVYRFKTNQELSKFKAGKYQFWSAVVIHFTKKESLSLTATIDVENIDGSPPSVGPRLSKINPKVDDVIAPTNLAKELPRSFEKNKVINGSTLKPSLTNLHGHEFPSSRQKHRHPIDIEYIKIESGPFYFGNLNTLIAIDKPFLISKFPITNEQYYKFMVSNQHISPPRHWRNKDASGNFVFNQELRNHPIGNITWLEAKSFCAWSGAELPSVEQWERAARWTDGRLFPWEPEKTDYRLDDLRGYCNIMSGSTTPVDKYRNSGSPDGIYDLIGNVWEFTNTQVDNNVILKGGSYQLQQDFERINSVGQIVSPKNLPNPTYGFRIIMESEKK